MTSHKYPGALPRKMHWSDEIGGHASCPDCGAPLEPEQHTYMMAIRRGSDMDFHLVGNTAGHFCEKCPLVVLDRDRFEESATLAARTADGSAFLVMGIVDLDAVPEDKKSLPFDDDTNPVPLVQFTNIGGKKSSSKSAVRRSSSQKRKDAHDDIPAGVRMKGGVAYDPAEDRFVAIVHSWDNAECFGEPLEWRSSKLFRTENAAMRFYKKSIRPSLKRKMKEASKQPGLTLGHRKIE